MACYRLGFTFNFNLFLICTVSEKLKLSLFGPGQTLMVLDVEGPRISRYSAHEVGMIHVRYSFLLGAESTQWP